LKEIAKNRGGIVERLYRILLFALFIFGFVGTVMGTNDTGRASVVSLIKDVRTAQEANMINAGRWSIQNRDELNSEALNQVEALFNDHTTPKVAAQ
jgi:hypothetical protein